MADRAAPEDPGAAGQSPVLVRVTVEAGPRRSVTSRQIGRLGLLAPAIVVVAIGLLAATVVGVAANRTTRTAEPLLHAPPTPPSNPGPGGVAAAYRYPRDCLDVTMDAADPAYASVRLNRVSPCWRYGVYVTAILHRIAGVWRMVLNATGTGCPMTSIPAVVRRQLGLCQVTGQRRPRAREPRPPARPDARPHRAPRTPDR
jgi:hypothetical protein